MPIRIFTIPFNEETQTFHDDLVMQFCVNKRVHNIETKFFTRNHRLYGRGGRGRFCPAACPAPGLRRDEYVHTGRVW